MESVAYVEQLVAQGVVTKHYRHENNDMKYPVMREMFYDPALPIDSKFILWFDDDSFCDKDPQWLTRLCECIIANPQAAMFGKKYLLQLRHEQIEFYKTRPWHRGKQLRTVKEVPAANGDKVFFITGGFWALSTAAMRTCMIPDVDLRHNGGDVMAGRAIMAKRLSDSALE